MAHRALSSFESLIVLPPIMLWLLLPLVGIIALFAVTRAYTTFRYRQDIELQQQNLLSPQKKLIITAPQIPFTIPFIGNVPAFLNSQPGKFWQDLFSWYPREVGACSLVLGGLKTHVLFSPHAVDGLFKNPHLHRHATNIVVANSCLDIPMEDCDRYYGGNEDRLFKEYLLKNERVNELTATFIHSLQKLLIKDTNELDFTQDRGFYAWLRDHLFTSSVTALMGEHLIPMYPDFCEDFYGFDSEFLGFYFKLPKFMIRSQIARREKLIMHIQAWNEAMLAKCDGGIPTEPLSGDGWEPVFGSRINRARQHHYIKQGISIRSRASFDLGMVFGLASNAVPASGWMVMHILDPDGDATLLGRVLAELRTLRKSDGSIDIPALLSQPLLLSIYQEVLRLYSDNLVSREVDRDLVLPLDEAGHRSVSIPKGTSVMIPSWLGHKDAAAWSGEKVPVDTFYAERFLMADPQTGKDVYTLDGTTGKLFPYGGGRTICPGRVFAKQEILAAVAMVLLNFEFEVTGFVDGQGQATKSFPGMKKSYPGSAIVVPGGDVMVRMRRRE